MVVEQWDRDWTTLDGYRGVNANMHSVEALLSAADVLGDTSLRDKAERILTRVVHDLAAGNRWRIPEHFDADWQPVLEYNVDEPAHPFRPYGATIGHWLEWARLALDLRASLGDRAPDWLLSDAVALFEASVREGWSVDGAPGFVYTVDWDGHPVVRERMHWVAAEATATAAALHEVTRDPAYAAWYETFWEHVATHFRDDERGSWRHELSPTTRAQRSHLGGQAGRLPRRPGHPAAPPPAVPDPRDRPRPRPPRLNPLSLRCASGSVETRMRSQLGGAGDTSQRGRRHISTREGGEDALDRGGQAPPLGERGEGFGIGRLRGAGEVGFSQVDVAGDGDHGGRDLEVLLGSEDLLARAGGHAGVRVLGGVDDAATGCPPRGRARHA